MTVPKFYCWTCDTTFHAQPEYQTGRLHCPTCKNLDVSQVFGRSHSGALITRKP